MPNYCTNKLTISGLTPDEKGRILSSFTAMTSEGDSHTSYFLKTFCPEPDYSTTPVLHPFPLIVAHFADTPEEMIEALVNEPTISDESPSNWRVINWGVKREFTEVEIDLFATESEFRCVFDSDWVAPCEGIFNISKKFPNALFKIIYKEMNGDCCGLFFVKNAIAFRHKTRLSNLQSEWLKIHHPELFQKYFSGNGEVSELHFEECQDLLLSLDDNILDWYFDPLSKYVSSLYKQRNIKDDHTANIDLGFYRVDISIKSWAPKTPESIPKEVAEIAAHKFFEQKEMTSK